MLALCVLASTPACSNQQPLASSQSEEPPPVGDKKRPSSSSDAGSPSRDHDELDAGAADKQARISTQKKQLDAGDNTGNKSEPDKPKDQAKEPAKKAEQSEPDKAKDQAKEEPKKPEQGSPDEPRQEDRKDTDKTSKMEPPKQEADRECTRVRLQEKAEAYLKGMATGDTMSLRIHPAFRYTENGNDEQLGGGAWLRRASTVSQRHVVDETSCGTLSQAVMDGLTDRFAFGVRLRYAEGLLLEAEAQVVPELLAATDLDTLIPMGDDPFVADVPQDKRMSRDELFDFAHRYFDSVTGVVTLPPSAPECRRLQNGLPLGNGTCNEAPGSARFEQQRFDLADEPNGIVTASVAYQNHIGFYLLKIADDELQNIVVIGGATSQATGW